MTLEEELRKLSFAGVWPGQTVLELEDIVKFIRLRDNKILAAIYSVGAEAPAEYAFEVACKTIGMTAEELAALRKDLDG